MKCPVCGSGMKRILYEGFAVFRCMNCHGYLMADRRLENIRRSDKRSVELLKQEVTEQSGGDTAEKIRCPRCHRVMKKKFIAAPASLHIDACRDCEMLWLDGGELARLQLSHEISARGRDAAEFRRRHREMTPEQKAQFEQDLEKLDSGEQSAGSILGETFLESLVTLLGGHRWS